jgi:hypothetical protein
MTTHCRAPYRLPDGYYDRLETMTPEEGAVTVIVEVLADDHACGDPAVGTVQYRGHTVPVCQYQRLLPAVHRATRDRELNDRQSRAVLDQHLIEGFGLPRYQRCW